MATAAGFAGYAALLRVDCGCIGSAVKLPAIAHAGLIAVVFAAAAAIYLLDDRRQTRAPQSVAVPG